MHCTTDKGAMMDQKQLLEQFKTHLVVAERAAINTSKTYYYDAEKFLNFLSSRNMDIFTGKPFEIQMIQDYVYYLRTTKKARSRQEYIKDSSISRHIHGLIAFWEFCHRIGLAPKALHYSDLDLHLKKHINPIEPLNSEDYHTLMETLYDELSNMV